MINFGLGWVHPEDDWVHNGYFISVCQTTTHINSIACPVLFHFITSYQLNCLSCSLPLHILMSIRSNRRCFQISSILLTYVITSIFVTMSIYCCFAENQQIGKSFGLGRWTFCVSAIFADEQILVTCSFLVFS